MHNEKSAARAAKGSELLQFIIMTILLFAFWLIMSGQFAPKLLVIGFLTCLIVAWITRPLMRLRSAGDPDCVYLGFYLPYHKLLKYFAWLFVEIIKANIYVVKIVLSPKLAIDPAVVTFKRRFDNPLAHAVLANSITVTPGTITIAIEDNIYYVHAITKESGLDLAPPDGSESEMPRRVAELFGEHNIGNNESKQEEA